CCPPLFRVCEWILCCSVGGTGVTPSQNNFATRLQLVQLLLGLKFVYLCLLFSEVAAIRHLLDASGSFERTSYAASKGLPSCITLPRKRRFAAILIQRDLYRSGRGKTNIEG